MMADLYDFGLVGLGVMGRNFILNVADHNFSAYGLDTDPAKVNDLKKEAGDKKVDGTTQKADFVAALQAPRKIMMLVPAGPAVDSVIADLLPLLSPGDLLIDGGNSFYADTDRREKYLSEKGIHFIGVGVSGGSEGARFGPSIMPGGDKDAYRVIQPIFEAVSAKVNGEPCVAYLGPKSAGNYVKMVHNGIEYGLMQLISEIYDVLKTSGKASNEQLANTFGEWNQGRLQSFLVEITSKILKKKDDLTDQDLVDLLLDKAKQKGTGKWTSQNAMDLGIAVPTIDSAVSLREISSQKDVRVKLGEMYASAKTKQTHDLAELTKLAEQALFLSYIVSYAQGFAQLTAASADYQYNLNMSEIAKIWRGGCIIRAGLLETIRKAYAANPSLKHLFEDEGIKNELLATVQATRQFVGLAMSNGIPVMALASALSYFDAMTQGRLPLNLVQAQRDYFGSHTYERTDREGIFHSVWH